MRAQAMKKLGRIKKETPVLNIVVVFYLVLNNKKFDDSSFYINSMYSRLIAKSIIQNPPK
jgi:hypothetical protein